MGLLRVLIEILGFLKFLWILFTVGFRKPIRLLNLPSLARHVIFSHMEIGDIYHLSKCSTRSRYAVKMFTRRQKYYFNITAYKSYCCLRISNRLGKQTFNRVLRPMNIRTRAEDVWAAAKEKVDYFFDVFTNKVNSLEFYDISNVTKMTELLKENTSLPVDWVFYGVSEIDDELYKYVWREFKDAKQLSIGSYPSADFRFDDMEPFTGDSIAIRDADWLTFDYLTRCFMNAEKIMLWTNSERYLKVHVLSQFLNAWINGLRVGKLDMKCDCATNIDLQSILKNVPKTEVKRVEVRSGTQVFGDRKCFLIRQEESGVEAIVYFNTYTYIRPSICFTTDFRLLRDDEFN